MTRHAFVCSYVRTPIGRYGGALAGMRPDDLAAVTLRAVAQRNPGLDLEAIDEVVLGAGNQAGEDNRNVARMSLLLADWPTTIPGVTVNRLCGSGMEAVIAAARAVLVGDAELTIAGGVESMSRAPFVIPKADAAFGRTAEIHDTTMGWRFVNPRMRELYGVDSMPETAENVAEAYGIDRGDQDAFALRSQQRAATAQAAGRHAAEIVPVVIPGRQGDRIVDRDEHPRPDTTLAALARLSTPFRAGGTVTAGNASGINDGAAAMIVASAGAVARFGLTPLARIAGSAVAGVEPRIMGMGPVPAVRKLLQRTGNALDKADAIELNEAFASQAVAVLRELGIPEDSTKVNPNGGAIALGHPVGMSGARLVGTAALQLTMTGGKAALVTMCIGVGQGIAAWLEAEQ